MVTTVTYTFTGIIYMYIGDIIDIHNLTSVTAYRLQGGYNGYSVDLIDFFLWLFSSFIYSMIPALSFSGMKPDKSIPASCNLKTSRIIAFLTLPFTASSFLNILTDCLPT